MTLRTHLAVLRRSGIGAWLACAYALAVLASALVPPAAAAQPLSGLLCSGLMAVPEGGGDPDWSVPHCPPCLPMPGLALLPVVPQADGRGAVLSFSVETPFATATPRPIRHALAQPRAPPSAA